MYFEFSLRGLLTAIFKRKDLFKSIFFLIVLTGGLYLWHMPRTYESRGALLIRFGEGALPTASSVEDHKTTEFSRDDREEIIQSNVSLLQSDDLLKEVIRTIGVNKIYPKLVAKEKNPAFAEHDAVIQLQKKGLKVYAEPKSNIIEIDVRNENPVIAQKVASVLMELFTTRQPVIFGVPQTAFLQQQADVMRKKMEQSQQDFRDFKQKAGITLLDEEIAQLLAEKKDLSVRSFEADRELQATVAKLANDSAALQSTYLPDSPVVARANHSLDVARIQLQKQSLANGIVARMTEIDKRLTYLEANRKHYEELKQRVSLDEENYKYYQLRDEEAGVNERLNQENITRVSIIDKPAIPLRPVEMNKALIAAAILVTAFLLSLGAVFFLELTDDTVIFSEQITAITKLPVLATLER